MLGRMENRKKVILVSAPNLSRCFIFKCCHTILIIHTILWGHSFTQALEGAVYGNNSRTLCFYSFRRTKYSYAMLLCTLLQCALYINIPQTRHVSVNRMHSLLVSLIRNIQSALSFGICRTLQFMSQIGTGVHAQNVLAQRICIFPELYLLVYFLYHCKCKFVIYSVYFIFDY